MDYTNSYLYQCPVQSIYRPFGEGASPVCVGGLVAGRGFGADDLLRIQNSTGQLLDQRKVAKDSRDEDPTFFSTDPAQLEKYSGSGSYSGSDLKSK